MSIDLEKGRTSNSVIPIQIILQQRLLRNQTVRTMEVT